MKEKETLARFRRWLKWWEVFRAGDSHISKNNTWRQVRPERLAHVVHIPSIANQDATTKSSSHLAHIAQHHIIRASPGATPDRQGFTWRNTKSSGPHLAYHHITRAASDAPVYLQGEKVKGPPFSSCSG